ncbi:MAG: site-2 protease family protein [Nitrospirae bacterium]|nr:site-2 protease family protein [Nitrospirota bacterium]
MQVPSWEIGRALGIPIRVHASWFVVFLLVTWSLSTGYLPDNLPGLTPERYWAMGGLAAVLLFVSVLLHELGHSYVALYYRIPIEKITLFIFGGVAHMRKEAPTPRAEFLIALAGPAVSFVIGGLCFVFVELAETIQRQHGLQGWIMLGALLGFVNMQIGLFNMIPGFPLDGGRMLRAGLWAWRNDFYRATKQAAGVGLGFGVMLGLAGLVVLYGSASGGLPASMASNGGWVVVIGMFLFTAALASRRQAVMRQALATVPIRDVMATTVTSIPSHCTLDVAVNQHFQSYGYGGFPVLEDGRLVGLITTVEIQSVPPSLWPWRRVEQVMRPRSESLVIEPDIPVMHALERMAREGWGRLVVMQDGEMVGLVTHSAIVRYLQLRGSSSR